MYNTRLVQDGEEPTVTVYDVPWQHEDGRLYLDTVIGTDMMAWITPGPLAPRRPSSTLASLTAASFSTGIC